MITRIAPEALPFRHRDAASRRTAQEAGGTAREARGTAQEAGGTAQKAGRTAQETGGNRALFGFWLEDGRLAEVFPFLQGGSLLGNIYVGKVKNVLRSIAAAFVEIAGRQTCFLPFSDARHPILTNRAGDGRLLAGDEVLVQVQRDAVKSKTPVLSADLSVSGRLFAVSIGEGGGIRYSHKLSAEEKNRIRQALAAVSVPDAMTLVVRTQARAEEAERLRAEAETLLQKAARILEIGRTRTVFSLLSEGLPDYLAVLEEAGGRARPDKIVTDDMAVYTAVEGWLPPEGRSALEYYRDPALSLTALYGLSGKLEEALSPRVWLRSGGYLVIEPTEALTVIDVNTGKYTGKKPTEETFRKINAEAAEEVARQLRLRCLSGIILVDFINMERPESQKELLTLLRHLCSRDPVPVQVVDMTPLGLVEITRKKRRRPLAEQLGMLRRQERTAADEGGAAADEDKATEAEREAAEAERGTADEGEAADAEKEAAEAERGTADEGGAAEAERETSSGRKA